MKGQGRGLQVYAVFYLLFLYAPIILLPLFAFNSGTIIAFPLQGFTTDWFAQMWANATLRTALTNSLIIAVSAAARTSRSPKETRRSGGNVDRAWASALAP